MHCISLFSVNLLRNGGYFKRNPAECFCFTPYQNKTDQELKEWLDKIPDNPAIYLRNQLEYEYWRKHKQTNDYENN